MNEYKIVMMCTEDTVDNVKKYMLLLLEFLNPKALVVIGSAKVGEIIAKDNLSVEFVDEDTVYAGMTFDSVKRVMQNLSNNNIEVVKRTGWYFQQFLKMAYCMECQEMSYLVWDADTIPTHVVEMIDKEKRYYFDIKTEYHEPYFDTISKLFPELKKKNTYSFISEHMIFKTQIMKEIINKIESDDLSGNIPFWEKILKAVSKEELDKSGFSEFETYGTYVEYYYPKEYLVRNWYSLREGTMFYSSEINLEQLKYLSQEYDAISFEKHEIHRKLAKVFSYKIFKSITFFRAFEKGKNLLKSIL